MPRSPRPTRSWSWRLVAGDGQAYAYPTGILNRHEIVNDELAGVPLVVTYCPLCCSGVVYDRRVDDRELTFGNTSAVYDNDLVMYDYQTKSYWWQIAGRAIVGELSGTELTAVPSAIMPWGRWRAQRPDTWVLSARTGFDRTYGGDGLDGYAEAVTAGRLPFPSAGGGIDDARLDAGTGVLGGVVDGTGHAYPLRALRGEVVNDRLAGRSLAVFVTDDASGRVFDRRVGGDVLTFERGAGGIVDRRTGTRWSAAGRAVQGPLAGTQLDEVAGRTAFWFAFAAAFPDAVVVTG